MLEIARSGWNNSTRRAAQTGGYPQRLLPSAEGAVRQRGDHEPMLKGNEYDLPHQRIAPFASQWQWQWLRWGVWQECFRRLPARPVTFRPFWRWLPDYETCAAPQRGRFQTSASLLDFSWMRSSFASRERRGKPAFLITRLAHRRLAKIKPRSPLSSSRRKS